jgi:hypothetical protein
MMCTFEMISCGMIFLQCFPKISKGVEGILRFCLSSLRGCIAGITDGNYAVEMGSSALIYIHFKFHKDWFRHSKVNKGEIARERKVIS